MFRRKPCSEAEADVISTHSTASNPSHTHSHTHTRSAASRWTPSLVSPISQQATSIISSLPQRLAKVKTSYCCCWCCTGSCVMHTCLNDGSSCMEMTPSLACANKCVFCWRHGTNPVAKEWNWATDQPKFLFEQATREHQQMIKQLKGTPGVTQETLADAMTIRHCALSLVGEPVHHHTHSRASVSVSVLVAYSALGAFSFS